MPRAISRVVKKDYKEDELDEPIQQRYPASPPSDRLLVKRGGHSITRQIPKPSILVDTREKAPFDFSRFPNWIAGEMRQKLDTGDYSIQGMEKLLSLERKSLSDLITTVIQERPRFFRMCEQLAKYRWRALLIEASYEDIKTPYAEEKAICKGLLRDSFNKNAQWIPDERMLK